MSASLISSVFGIIGAFLVANGVFAIGYTFFMIGSFAGIIAAKEDKALAAQFVVFTICNIIGLVRNWPF